MKRFWKGTVNFGCSQEQINPVVELLLRCGPKSFAGLVTLSYGRIYIGVHRCSGMLDRRVLLLAGHTNSPPRFPPLPLVLSLLFYHNLI